MQSLGNALTNQGMDYETARYVEERVLAGSAQDFKFVQVGIAPSLAVEIGKQINTGTYRADYLVNVGMPWPQARALVDNAVPGWALGADLAWDFAGAPKYFGAADPADTHAASIYAPNAAGVYTSFGANVLTRTNLGLQTVPTRTNLCLQSQDFSNATWTKYNTTIVADAAVAPDGTTTANKLTETVANSFHSLTGLATIVAGSTNTISIFASASGGRYLVLGFDDGGANGFYAAFDLLSGVVSQAITSTFTGVGLSATISNYGSYFRCTITGGIAPAATAARMGVSQSNVASPGVAYPSYAGSTSNSIFLWNAQIETAPFASPPILTTSASATVNGNQQALDSQITGRVATGFGFVFKANLLGTAIDNLRLLNFDIDDNNRVAIDINSGNLRFVVVTAGVGEAVINLGAYSAGVKTFAAIAAPNFVKARIVGGSDPASDTTVSYAAPTHLAVGGQPGTPVNNTYQISQKFAIWLGTRTYDQSFYDNVIYPRGLEA